MTSNIERRVAAIVNEMSIKGDCQTCYGTGPCVVFVPDGADPDAPEYNPTVCPECGARAQRLIRVIGIDLCQAEKTFGPLVFQPRPTDCE